MELKIFKGRMKRKPTPAESVFWRRLIESGIPFKRQVIFGFYIVDFVLHDKLLCIEIDDPSHEYKKSYDDRRSDFLRSLGLTVLRVKNEDVEEFDTRMLRSYPDFPSKMFRSALGRASALRGKEVERMRKVGAGM